MNENISITHMKMSSKSVPTNIIIPENQQKSHSLYSRKRPIFDRRKRFRRRKIWIRNAGKNIYSILQVVNIAIKSCITMIKEKINLKQYDLDDNPTEEDFFLKRQERLEDIFLGKCTKKIDSLSIASCFMGIVLSIIGSAFNLCWPQHDPLKFSEYWFEAAIVSCASFAVLLPTHYVGYAHLWAGSFGRRSFVTLIIVLVACFSLVWTYYFASFYVWVNLLNLSYPIPYQLVFIMLLSTITTFFVIWFHYPMSWRQDNVIKKRFRAAVLGCFTWVFVATGYQAISLAFQYIPNHINWIMVFVPIPYREFNSWFYPLIIKKLTKHDDDLVIDIIAGHYFGVWHVLFLSRTIGTLLGNLGHLLLAVDFTVNISFTLAALWYGRKEQNQLKKVDHLLSFIINEAVECIIPIAYLLCLLIAFYGPNVEHLGNIKFGGWNFSERTNLNNDIFWLLIITTVDFGSLIIGGALLKILGGLNVFRIYAQLQSDVGLLLAIAQGFMVSWVGST